MSYVRRAASRLKSEDALVGFFIVAIFYGNIYGAITLPLSIVLLPLLAIRFRVKALKWQALLPAVACASVALQVASGYLLERSDVTVYFSFLYSAIVVLVLVRVKVQESTVVSAILIGAGLISIIMLLNAGWEYQSGMAFYEMKNLVVTPLGSSNYLAVFIMFGLVIALYWKKYLYAAALTGAFMLTFSRTGYGMLALAAGIWIVDTRTALVRRWPKTSLTLLFVVVFSIFFVLFFKNAGLPESLAVRSALWHAAMYHIADYPIFGTPRSEYLYIFNGRAWDPHNSVLNLLLLLGVVGAFIYFIYLYFVLSLFARLARVSIFWRAVLVAVLVTLAWSLFEVVLLTPAYDILLAALYGIALSVESKVTGAATLSGLSHEPSANQALQR